MSKIVQLLEPYCGTQSGWVVLHTSKYEKALRLIKELEEDLEIYRDEYRHMSQQLRAADA